MYLAAAISLVAIATLSNPFGGGQGDPLWKRWQLAEAGLEIFVQSNGVGVGVGNFPTAVEPLPIETSGTLASHNWLLYLFGEFGIIGASLFLAAYARLLYDLFEQAVSIGSALQIGVFATLVALPVGALSPSNAIHTHTLWLFIGLAATVAYLYRSDRRRAQ